MISFAREKGWFEGRDEDFSFRDAFNPLDFSGARACDARAWSAFNILGDGTFTYMEDGREVSRPASDWVDYAMGYDLKGEMPLFIKPSRKIGAKDVADVMRDHYEGTPSRPGSGLLLSQEGIFLMKWARLYGSGATMRLHLI